MVVFSCKCGRQLQAREEFAGELVRCPECSRTMPVPGRARSDDEDDREERRHDRRFDEDDRPRRRRFEDDSGRWRLPRMETSGKAVAALVLGIASFVGSVLFSIPAIVLGAWSIRDIGRSKGALTGKTMAVIGMICGVVGTFCSLPTGGLGIWLATAELRDRTSSEENLETIGQAMLTYQTRYGTLPPAAIYKGDRPMLSWRVAILPQLGEQFLYMRFRLDEPWDSPSNLLLLNEMPEVYAAPGDKDRKPNHTFYRVFHKANDEPMDGPPLGDFAAQEPVGPMFVGSTGIANWNVPDGSYDTFLIVEAAQAVPWTKPDEIAYPVNGPVEAQLGGIFKGGYHVLMADCMSVRYFNKAQITDSTLRGAITRNGGEAIMLPLW